MRFTIHFSPSSCERPRRVERSLITFVSLFVVRSQIDMCDSLDIDALVNLAVALGNQMPRRIDKLVRTSKQEEIVLKDDLCLAELLLRLLEVEVDVQGLDEVGDRVGVLVALLSDNPDQVLQLLLILVRVPGLIAAGDYGRGEVAQDPWAVGLDCVDVGG